MAWLVGATAPWWAPVVASLISAWLGYRFSSKASDKQRIADQVDRQAERKSALQMAEMQRDAEAAARETESRASAVAEVDGMFKRLATALASAQAFVEVNDFGSDGFRLPETPTRETVQDLRDTVAQLHLHTGYRLSIINGTDVVRDLAAFVRDHPEGADRGSRTANLVMKFELEASSVRDARERWVEQNG